MRRLGRIARGLAHVVLWLVAGLLMLALALLLVLRTTPGRRALLRVALPLVNARMAGHLSVRGLDGDLWNQLVLVDARLDDAEGLEAIYVRRLEARLDWRGALSGRIHVRDLRVDGARLTLRHLLDNRLNLAAMAKPSPRQAPPPDKHKEPPLVVLDHFHLQLEGAYHPPLGHEANLMAWPRGSFDIEGAASFRGADIHIVIARFVSDSRDPLHAHVELRGGLKVTPHGTPVGKAELAFEDVAVTVTSDGDELSRLAPGLRPRGRWALHAEGGGPLSGLHAHAVVSAPSGNITIDGSMARRFPGIRWQAVVNAADLNPRDWHGLSPPGRIELALHGRGDRDGGELVVERLSATSAGIAVEAQGHSDFAGHGDGTLRASLDSLARLGGMGVRLDGVDELDGAVRLSAELGRDARGPRLTSELHADRLWLRKGHLKTKVGALVARMTLATSQAMTVRLESHRIEVAGVGVAQRAQLLTLRIDRATLALDGKPTRFGAAAAAVMADGTRAQLRLQAALAHDAADLRIDALEVARGKQTFTMSEPMRLHLTGTPVEPRVRATLAGARLEAHLRFGHEALKVVAALEVPDLARVGRLSGVPLAGAVRAHVDVGLQKRLTIDAVLDGDGLRGPHLGAGHVHVALRSVDLEGDARVDGERLQLGPLSLTHLGLHARGGQERLRVTVDGERPDPGTGATRLKLELDGRWHTDGLAVRDADLLVRAIDLDLPRQSWRLVAPAHLMARGRTLAIENLRVRSGVGEVRLDGRVDGAAVDLVLGLHDGDLEELSRAAGRPGLLPPARWSGRVHLAGTPSAPLVEATLEARAANTVTWYGLGFNALSLTAFADSRHAIVHADAHGLADTRVVVDIHGTPRQEGGRFVALSATLDRLELAVRNHRWQLRDPCTVDVAPRLAISGCTLGSGRAEISLAGAAPLSPSAPNQSLDLTLATRHLDLRDLGALLAPGHQQPPKTDFAIHVHLAGTRPAPVVDLSLAGRGAEIDEGGLPENVNYRIRAHYADQRVNGQASMRQVGLHLGTGATFDLPTTLEGDQPIHVELEARPVPFFKVRNLLPTQLGALKGFFTLRLNASGSTRHPHVTAVFHAPSWGLADLRDNNTIVNLAYDGRELSINSVTSFEAQGLIGSLLALHPPRNAGTATMELRAPVDLVRLLKAPRDALHALVHDAPMVASAEVRNVDLRKVPMQVVGFDAPLTLGHVNAAARLEGTLHKPSLHVDVHAIDLAQTGVIDHLDLDGSLQWEGGRMRVSGAASLRSAPLLRFRGVALLDARALFDGDDWQAGALDLDVQLPSFPLRRLRNLQPRLHAIDGVVSGSALVRGSWGAPDLQLVAHARDVTLAEAHFAKIDADARLRQRRWTFAVDGDEGAGRLHVDGQLPHDRSQPMAMTVDARALDVGFVGALWEEIGAVHGTLGAHVWVSGTRAAPRPNGWATLDGGVFQFRGDARRYQGSLALRIDGEEARLTRLELRGGGGTLEASGRARLDGLFPTELSLSARAQHFELAYGSAMARLDADFTIAGDRGDGVFKGELRLARGTIRLPDLSGLGEAGNAGGLSDVRFDDSRAHRAQARRSAGQGLFIATRIDGPLQLRSSEADLDLVGELGVTVAGGSLGIDGVLESRRGTMELLGHRYQVERAQLAFAGAADDPELHLRATRRVGAATLAVVIEGTGKNPSVRLSCEPPIYDEAQLVSLVLAGRAGSDRIALHDLNRQIAGLLSALVIRRIEQQLAPSLPIDVVRPLDQQSYAEFSQSPLEVGRFVSDRVYVQYSHRYGSRIGRSAANADEASAEYRLGRGFEVDTTFGDAGVGGVYLFWTAKH